MIVGAPANGCDQPQTGGGTPMEVNSNPLEGQAVGALRKKRKKGTERLPALEVVAVSILNRNLNKESRPETDGKRYEAFMYPQS